MKKYNLPIIFLFVTTFSFGQIDFKQVVPPNPNVASLFKSVITPINEYSGLPNVSIPLYTISEGNISLPISLSYATGGIQVSEESGIVGLGWALNAGGAITRSVNGVDDFNPSWGYLSNTQPVPDLGLFNPGVPLFTTADNLCRFPVNGTPTLFLTPTGAELDWDYQPDMYHFNFNGYSGSFVMRKDRSVVLLNKQGIDIQIKGSGTNNLFNIEFIVTVEDGTVYQFSERASTQFPNGNLPSYTSTWYLTKVTDTAGNFVELQYTDYGFMEPLPSFTQSWQIPTDLRNSSNPSRVYINTRGPRTEVEDIYLSEIRFGHSADLSNYDKVVLNYSANGIRKDVKTRYLESIIVTNRNDQVVKNHNFNYSYFGRDYGVTFDYNDISIGNGDFGQEIAALSPQYPHLNFRLRLDSVVEDNTKTHSFDYFEPGNIADTPNKTTFGQDYWGFFNNEPNYGSFIPEIRDEYGSPVNFDQFNKAKRFPNEKFAKYFSLKKITYPTKGSTEFDFELNTYDASNFPNVTEPPTVPMDERASVNPSKPDDQIVIRPNRNASLFLDYSVVIIGWNRGNDGTLPKPQLTNSNFANSFYVTLEDLDGNIIVKKRIPTDAGDNLWTAFNPDTRPCGVTGNGNNDCSRIIDCNPFGNTDYCTSNNCTPGGGQPAIIFTCSEEWKYNNPLRQLNLTEDEYVLKAHFDDLGGKIYGQAFIRARWDDVNVSEEQMYSMGGGLRVKSIIDRDNDANETITTKRNFNYHYNESVDGQVVEKSYGRIKTLPNYFTDHKTIYSLELRPAGNFSNYYANIGLPKITGKATSHNSFSKDAGSYVTYDQIEITYEGSGGDNGKTIKKFHNVEDLYLANNPIEYIDDYYKYPPVRLPINGLHYKTENYRRTNNDPANPIYDLVSETSNKYTVNGFDAAQFDFFDLWTNPDLLMSAVKEMPTSTPIFIGGSMLDCNTFKFQFHPYFSNLVQQTETTEVVYDTNSANPVTTAQQFAYENDTHLQRTKTTMTESDGSVVETKVYYPDDITSVNSLPEGGPLNNYPYIQLLQKDMQHQIATPVQTTTKRDGQLLSIQRTEFGVYGQYTHPITNLNADVVLPNITQTAKGTTPLEDRLVYEDYLMGNPIQMRKEDGTPISYIWGYNNTYPIAKIENASYDDIADALGISTSALKNYDHSNLPAINGLRSSHPEFIITTFTFDPLVGMTSTTDPRNYTMTYSYDELNRLKEVKDADGHLVTDYKYHYKGQNQQ
ncbi:RHS repeat domain-containing protein [Spongiimicrobium sp. 3-5]|uniref:RHS repeat protein n=1 Tax=Spongiimicrobium sp. 3-5 TaxID=3332596 RepID=UPI00397F3AD9